jgi:CBS domain-containing protein
MQRLPLCVSPETDIFALASIFTRHPHRHLPVVVKKRLVGIISRRDVLRGLYEFERKVCADRAKCKGRSLLDFRQLINLRFIIK